MLRQIRIHCRLIVLIWPLFLASSGAARAGEVSQEYQLKAAFLYNFARFISWPKQALPDKTDTINFCIIGVNPFASILANLETKQIDGHPVRVLYFQKFSTEQQCHLSFYSNSETTQIDQLDHRFSGQYTLSVSDIPGFTDAGGDIEFTRKQDRIEFIINNTALKKKGLQPRASLLELAAAIR